MLLIQAAVELQLEGLFEAFPLTVCKNGETITLTKTEFMILELLMKNPGRIYTKQQIIDYAWGSDFMADDNTVMVHISNLRSKIETQPKTPVMLKTIKGLGYKFEKEM